MYLPNSNSLTASNSPVFYNANWIADGFQDLRLKLRYFVVLFANVGPALVGQADCNTVFGDLHLHHIQQHKSSDNADEETRCPASYACFTHRITSGIVAFFPYINIPMR